jgi:hypothetical protein
MQDRAEAHFRGRPMSQHQAHPPAYCRCRGKPRTGARCLAITRAHFGLHVRLRSNPGCVRLVRIAPAGRSCRSLRALHEPTAKWRGVPHNTRLMDDLTEPELDADRRLRQMQSTGVSLSALALYSRWWGLETWLRELAYIELRSRFGPAWQSEISRDATSRRERDDAREYMRSADVSNALAYEGVFLLFRLIEGHWRLFKPSLLPSLTQWTARQEELLEIRHRIGHCRHPHKDDIARVEQTLRDLEPGAWTAASTYNNTHSIPTALDDPVVEAWVRQGCADAQRLVGHAERNYDTSLRLEYSLRPWAVSPPLSAVSGQEGALWAVRFVLRGRRVHPVRLLMEWNEHSPMPEPIIHLLAEDPAHLLFTISALEEPEDVIDIIGRLFDIVLTCSTDWSDYTEDVLAWHAAMSKLDHRVQSDSRLVLVSDDVPHFPVLMTSAWTG